MKLPFLLLALALVLPACSQQAPLAQTASHNQLILQALKSMPAGGGYDSTQTAVDRFATSITATEKLTQHDLKKAGPTFCSSATYVVFLRALNELQTTGTTQLPPKTIARFAQCGVKDGFEIFGRWNANGPGTAKLFADLQCGVNFTSYDHARPGDFMKIWWTREIGKRERGHLVVYLGTVDDQVHFWSANQPDGYGRKSVPKSRIRHVLFSRLTYPAKLQNAAGLPAHDPFLAQMLTHDFTWDEVAKKCRVKTTPQS